MKLALTENADTSHEDAREWYAGYGAHISTEHAGDITHDAVDYDWLDDDTNQEIAEKLMVIYGDLSEDEGLALARLARRIREAAETVVGLLEDAVIAYDADDLDAVIEALDAASSEESEHGDDPAAQSLRKKMVEEVEENYSVKIEYRAMGNWMDSGGDSEDFDNLDEAKEAAEGADTGEYSEGEYRATVTDNKGATLHTHEWKVDTNQEKFDGATWLATAQGEHSTSYYGISEDGEWVKTEQNGGSHGAYSAQEYDGHQSNMADVVVEITLVELLKALISSEYCGLLEAVKIVEKAHDKKNVTDLILEIAKDWAWTDEEKESVTDWIVETSPTWGFEIIEALGLVLLNEEEN